MRTWIKSPLAILLTPERPCNGLVINNNIIEQVLAAGELPEGSVDEQIDASELVVLPGLVNTHHHYYQTLTRAFPPALNKALFPWLQSLYPVWAGLTPEMIDTSTRLASAELLMSGCTTSADHHYLFPENVPSAMDVQAEAVRDIGIRTTITRGSMSLGEDQGGLPPRTTIQDTDTILADSQRVIDAYHDSSEGAMLQIALAPCSPFSVSRELMMDTAQLARNNQVRLHTHLAETHDETGFCLKTTGMRPLAYLEDTGWLASDTWLAHGIHFDDDEIAKLGQHGVGITHCPSSNMVLGSGICRGRELEQAGANVGLGVDGSASNDGSNMIQEVRQALLIQRLRYGSDAISHYDVFRWATSGSAACLGRGDIGELAPGKLADLALFKLDDLQFSGTGDPLAALILCGAQRAWHVMVNGNWRVRNGQFLGEDIPELTRRHRAQARELTAVWL